MTTIYEKNVPPGQEFVFGDGTKIHNIQELGEKISIVDDGKFHQYVNDEKNDFVNWLVYSLGNEELANIIAEIKSRPLMYLKIRQYILKNKTTDSVPPIQKHIPVQQTEPVRQAPDPAVQQAVESAMEAVEPKPTIVQKIKETATNIIPQKQPEPTQVVQTQPVQQPQPTVEEHHHEEIATEFVVKEFIYGVVCGILIGLIVAKIIEILF